VQQLYATPSLLISPGDKVAYLSEHAARYLVRPGTEPTADVFKLLREELREELWDLLQAARATGQFFDSKPVPVCFDGCVCPVVMHVGPALEPGRERFILIVFEEHEPQHIGSVGPGTRRNKVQTGRLEGPELDFYRQFLRAVIDEYEISREEMKAANEEMHSVNEEFRATLDALDVLQKEELRGTNETLVNQREVLRVTLGSIREAVLATDAGGNVTFLNSIVSKLTGCTEEQSLGQPVQDVLRSVTEWRGGLSDDVAERVTRALRGETATNAEFTLRRKDTGEKRVGNFGFGPIRNADGAIVGSVVVGRDITEERKAEERHRQAQRLESLGVLAQGIAHDFNNLLGGVLAEAELLLADTPVSSPASDSAQRIRDIASRGGEIVRQLMTYAGQENTRPEPVHVNQVVRDMLNLLKMSISKHAVLRVDLSDENPVVLASPSQIRQILLNLITNASEALGDRSGSITVRTTLILAGPDSQQEVSGDLRAGSTCNWRSSIQGAG
jgi:PAS domain S-box-containing protein